MKPPQNTKQVRAFFGLVGYYCRFIKNFARIANPLKVLISHDAKFALTSGHHAAFNTLKSALIEAPILHYPDHSKCYILYTDASDEACGAQMSQEYNGQELPVAFPSLTFTDTQWKLATTEQEACGIYYAATKWNYHLQGSDMIVCNDHKPLHKFLNGKNANNKVNRWSLEWISGAHKTADCLSQMVDGGTFQ